ncbi:hypothetical protein GCM10022254_27570 [Actinomadura meridiana]|uniref:Uncharacterized protein n=1 Tax=Actinomadura meridiana TaxID=559626 RepID=A0ABP8BZR3_9ACTN
MREDIGAAAVLLDEAETLFGVEPLDRTGGHVVSFVLSRPHTVCGEDAAMAHPEGPEQQKMRLRSDPTGA